MKLNRNWLIAAVAGIVVPAAIALAGSVIPFSTPSTVLNCTVEGSCQTTVQAPVTSVQSSDLSFGSADVTSDHVTRWLSGDFDEDLNVDREFTVTGTSTIQGYVSSTSIVREAFSGFTSTANTATSQTLCSFQNKSLTNRVLTDVTLGYSTTSRTASTSQWFTISLSATQGATGTGSNLLYDDTTNSLQNSTEQFTPTSTLQGTGAVRVIWRPNVWLNYLIASPTTTLTGDCRASYY